MSIEAEQQLFAACLEAADETQRERLLAQSADPLLAARVRRLLAHASAENSDLGTAAAPPTQIDAFRILERLGEGAIGEVYLAEQQQPVRRRVALKILKLGLSTREVLARFELERQTLAMMTHPNVARILDAGTTADGRPYFAMEYVPGIPITRYGDEHRLSLTQRLALFADTCAGVQHAHLRGVIHRDLKPGNILVTEVDGRPLPKIIDFGIAKATSPSATGDAFTRIGHVLGTPEYMSPEQVQLSPLDIDARTDVYSLGMLLYELLTGGRPYAVTRDSLDPAVIARDILDGTVLRPSQLAAQTDAEGVARAAARSVTPPQLAARLRGDLDWIVLRALEKDRQRRYASVPELAADLERARTHQPVIAGPPSLLYVLGKLARRHRLGVAVLSTVLAAVMLFGTGMAWLAHRAEVERDRANREAQVARRVTDFTAGLFAGADPVASGGSPRTARELLDSGVLRLESQLLNEPEDVQAALFEAAATAYRGLGEYARAAPLLERAVALRAASTRTAPAAHARALHSQAALARARGDFIQAETRLRESVRAISGADPADSKVLGEARLELAQVLRLRSRYEEAQHIATELVQQYETAQPPDNAGLAQALTTLGRIETDRGQLTEATAHLERGLSLHSRVFGDADPKTFDAKAALAWVMVTRDQSAKAEPLLREVVEDARRIYGPTHPETGVALSNLANAVSDLDGRLTDAEQIYLESIAVLRHGADAVVPELANSLNNLCSLYLKAQRWVEARNACAEATALRLRALGPEHPDTAGSRLGEAVALNRLGEYGQAEQLLRGVIATFTEQLGADHWRTANAQTHLGVALTNLKRYGEASAVLLQAERTLLASFGPDHYRTRTAREAIAALKARQSPVR
ncbi:MAG TPA: serine/threonine-protein kinase [Steroidobacteraceae bacterium]|nr:serine/threonine-protein kinase [Steroidobacteraceae bacterium]